MGIKILVKNRKAFHEYQIGESIEAGIELLGTEVKSIRAGKITLGEGFIEFHGGEAFLVNVHINHYTHGNINNHEEKRKRKLLLKKKEIIKLLEAMNQKGFSVIPTKVYLKGQLIKVEVSLGKGKQLHDKRASSKERDANRDIERAMRR